MYIRVGMLMTIGLPRADVFPPMIQVRRNDQQSWVFLAHRELIHPPEGRRAMPAIEDNDLHQSVHHKQTVDAYLDAVPRPARVPAMSS